MAAPLTREQVEQLDALYERTTPGQWTHRDVSGYAHPYVAVCVAHAGHDVIRLHDEPPPHVDLGPERKSVGALFATTGKVEREQANAECISALHNAWPALRELALRSLQPQETEWRSAALAFGELLASVGPNGYYYFTAEQWTAWAKSALESRNTGLGDLEK